MSQQKDEHANALDRCLALIAQGEPLEACLDRYPEQAAALRPLLMTAQTLAEIPLPAPDPDAVTRGEARMLAALDARASQPETEPAPGWLARRVGGVQAWFIELFSGYRRATLLRLSAGLALLLIFIAALVVLAPGGLLDRPAVAGIPVVETAGQVERLPAAGDAWAELAVGDVVAAGDKVRVALDGRAVLASEMAGVITLVDDTLVTFVRVPAAATAGARSSWMVAGLAGLGNVAAGWAPRPVVAAEAAVAAEAGLVLVQDYGTVLYTPPDGDAAADVFVEIYTPSGVARARGSSFTVKVTPDGIAEVTVQRGQVAITTGGVTETLDAGDVGSMGPEVVERPTAIPETPDPTPAPASESPAVSLPPARDKDRPVPTEPVVAEGDPKDTTDPSEEVGVRPTVIPEETPAPAPPPGDDGSPPADDAAPETPPGQDEDRVPPGLEDKGGVPPGLEDKGGTPPGQQDKDDKDKGKDGMVQKPRELDLHFEFNM